MLISRKGLLFTR